MSSDDRQLPSTSADRGAWLIALLFFVVSLPWLGSVAHYHGDERFYTDAALRMLQSGDWLRPVYADGEPRLNKPLFTYWVLIATYATAGISLFLSRLPFLVAGALVVGLAGKLARTLFPRAQHVAPLAAAIVACDVELSVLARRSTPDVFVVLFATASMYGLARIVVAKERGAAPRAWFWIGTGLSVATKGGWGILTALFGVITLLVLRKRGHTLRELVHAPSMLLALVIGAIGLAGSFAARGTAEASSLFQDQVGTRFVASPGDALSQAWNYAGSALKHFLPWSALIVVALVLDRGTLASIWRAHARSFGLAFGWLALLLVVFSLSNTHRGRYLAPAHPILACACAAWLVESARSARVGRLARRIGTALTVLLASVLSLLALALARIDVVVALSVAVTASIAVIALVRTRAARDERSFVALALALVALAPLAAEPLRALVDPSAVPAGVERLLAAGPRNVGRIGALGFFEASKTPSTASQMRVLSGGVLDPLERDVPKSVKDVEDLSAALATDAARATLVDAGFEVEPCGRIAPDLSAREAWRLLTAKDPRAWLAERGQTVWIALRPGAGSTR